MAAVSEQIKILQNYDNSLKHSIMVFEANKKHFEQQKNNNELFAFALEEYARKKILAEQLQMQLQATIKEENARKDAQGQAAETEKQQAAQFAENQEQAFDRYMQEMLDEAKSVLPSLLEALAELTKELDEMIHSLDQQMNQAQENHQNAHQELSNALGRALDPSLNPELAELMYAAIPDKAAQDAYIANIKDRVRENMLTHAANESLNQAELIKLCAQAIQPNVLAGLEKNDLNIAMADKIGNILIKAVLGNESVRTQVKQLRMAEQISRDLVDKRVVCTESQKNLSKQANRMTGSFQQLHVSATREHGAVWQRDLDDLVVLMATMKQLTRVLQADVRKIEQEAGRVFDPRPKPPGYK
jgi:hypothetical protein